MQRMNERGGGSMCGIPIGNLTSQIFANIYMNEFDQFVKHELKVKRYARYTDDFLIISHDRKYLEYLLPRIDCFLRLRLNLNLHPQKVSISPYHQGTDFLGYVMFPHHILVRGTTKRRMFRRLRERAEEYRSGRISEEQFDASVRSYLGVLSHADAYEVGQELLNRLWLWQKQ